jgi:redox-sensitive bicupin YhaK (pirin superfamily)
VILEQFDGISSPVISQWDTLYVDLHLQENRKIQIPKDTEERAIYVLKGQIEISGTIYDPQQMMVFNPGENVTITSE